MIDENKLNKSINNSYYYLNKYYKDVDLCVLSLIRTYCKLNNLSDIFDKVIKNSKIIIDDDTANNTFKKLFNREYETSIESLFYTEPINFNCNKKILGDINRYILINKKSNEKIVDNKYILESFVHEISHAMGSINNFHKFEFDLLYIRTGLYEIYYDDFENISSCYDNNCFEEVHNVYITNLIINEILNYKNYNIKNIEIKKFLNTLNLSSFKSTDYMNLQIQCEDLIENKELIELLNYIKYYGNNDQLIEYFQQKKVNIYEYANKLANLYDRYSIKDSLFIKKQNKKLCKK